MNAETAEPEENVTMVCLSENIEAIEDKRPSKRLAKKMKPEHMLVMNSGKSYIGTRRIQKSLLLRFHTLDNWMPKQILSSDELYLRRCLELIYISGLKAASCNTTTNMHVVSEALSSIQVMDRSTCEFVSPVVELSLAAGQENVTNSSGEWILGTITKSKSMINILNIPLLFQLAALNGNVKFGGMRLTDITKPIGSTFLGSSGVLSHNSSKKLLKEMVLVDYRYKSDSVHRRLVSISSTSSSCLDQPSSSASAYLSQGMLQCTWKNGFPHYTFCINEQRETITSNLCKVESSDDKVLDYVYTFHSRTGNRKEQEIRENKENLVGKMKVSTSFTFCPNNREIMETQFVLFGFTDNCVSEIKSSNLTIKRKGLLPKKFVDALRTSHSPKKVTSSKIHGTSAVHEDSSWETCDDACSNQQQENKVNFSEYYLPPNLELAAIVVRDHVLDNPKETGNEGWGLKFLKKVGISKRNSSLEMSLAPECCAQNTGGCSSGTEVILPAGFHGGPRSRNGGPSSLVERWSSGGRCDCGGWDIGCPLTVLNTRPSMNEISPETDILEKYKSFDLFMQGSKEDAPIMKIINTHDGSHCVHFESTMSALQACAIAAAIIHSCTRSLLPRVYRSCSNKNHG